jgi:predicted RNase H-like HicB family nuclease
VRNEFTAIVEQDQKWYIGYCLEIPGANGQGKSKEEALQNLAEAISLILEDRREDGLRGIPDDAIRETVIVRQDPRRCAQTITTNNRGGGRDGTAGTD